MMKRAVAVALSVAMVMSLVGCAAGAGSGAGSKVSAVSEQTLPQATWQDEVVFPDWDGTVEQSLAMNSMYSFKSYHDQGKLYVTPAEGVESFKLFINNQEFDTSAMKAGSSYAVDFSKIAVDGTSTIQVSNIQPAAMKKAVKVNVPYPTVLDGGTLQEAGISQTSMDAISSIVENDIAQGFTSAQLAVVKDGKVVYQNSWGKLNTYNQDGTVNADSPAVTNDTLYDLASNTKMYSVNYALQKLVTDGKISLDTKVVDILGQRFVDDTIDIGFDGYTNPGLATVKKWKSELTLRDFLRHQAGFPADPEYFNDKFNQQTQKEDPSVENVLYSGFGGTPEVREATLEAICKTPLMYEPGSKTLYSDVDYMLLGFVVEQAVGMDLQSYLKQTFWDPMGLKNITYKPLENGFSTSDIAATELNGDTRDGSISFTGARTETLQGIVHDGKAYHSMGGVSGHAGIFASATDLAKLASVMLTGGYGENRFFSQDVMDMFTSPKKEDDASAQWGLGWWREADNSRAKYFGTESSSDTFGHQGWTGTLTMIEPDENLVVVYLTNKINSRVTDPKTNTNQFNGNWYTSASLGFVNQLLQMGLDAKTGNLDTATTAIIADMAAEKAKLVTAEAAKGTITAEHPIMKSEYALLETLFKRAEASKSDADWALCKNAVGLLDGARDAAEIEALSARLPK